MSDAVLKVSISAAGAELSSFDVRIQEGLSFGLVKRIVHELAGKRFKAALDSALAKLPEPGKAQPK
jgi:hypothetical protein